ncbi:MAG: glycosyltransferase family 4 protein [Ruminiclostridium sp.]|nr:glycosyltransferase family 4 protein [Ruminiclostridium sp.]
MRVAIFTETYLPAVNGVVTHVKTLKEGLELLGHKAIVVTADSNVKKTQASKDILYCPAVKLEKIYGYDVASPISADRLRMLKDFNPDIIHIHNEFGIGLSGVLIAKALKVPLVYTMHTMYDDYVYYVANNELLHKFLMSASHKYAKILADSASALTGPSKKVEEYFKKCHVDKPVTVIPNSVEVEVFNRHTVSRDKVKEIRERYGFGENDLVFCFCGRMGQEKNIDTLLKYWAEKVKPHDGMKLFLIGGGPQLEEYKELAKSLNISDTVKFSGRVEHSDIPPYYASCDCYITASLTECHSISMMEGMATGMPVLTIRDELNADQIEEGVSGYYFRDADEMYCHMKHLKSLSFDELEKFKEDARRTIVSSGAQSIAEKLLVIYDEAIKAYSLKRMYKKSPRNVKKAYRAQYGDPVFGKRSSRPKRKLSVKAKRVSKEEKQNRRKAEKAAAARYNAAKEIRRQHKKRSRNK